MKKTVTKNGKISVTFELPAEVATDEVVVLGDFNGWSAPTPMKRRKDGTYAATVRLEPGRYRFRYLLDGSRWENDWAADDYVPNSYGSDDSVLVI